MAAKSAITRSGAIGFQILLQSELEDIASGISDEVDQVIREEVEKVAEAAKGKLSGYTMPYSTGDLMDSIHVVEDSRPGYSGYRVVADAMTEGGKYQVPVGVLVEYGFQHKKSGDQIPPRKFMTPALEEAREGILDAVNAKIKELAE